ncbi:PREDICTED: interferon alpha/beta receptor 1a-like [Cyprinodon variegatus]|uniref:Interferon alpha/beta receptor 1a-like n=1 Tax=Cyprinodon variegatus TaxID=28743 RepID=A0A3Q2E2B7_CYPVA|nr:PREDICTED: interferon alpha/beta receptor 1a-like [Cyprinodon variegatus]
MLTGLLCLLFVGLQSGSGEAELIPPSNLNMITFNTNYTLVWDWDQSSAGADQATFTVQYIGIHQLRRKNPRWNTACSETSERSCDLTELQIFYLGIYVLRVRANMDGRHSDWSEKQFCPDKEAVIGPPSKVQLVVDVSSLDVFITDPQTSTNTSMREHIPKLDFNIVYWEQAENGKVLDLKALKSSNNLVNLPDLKEWTLYCVQVQSLQDFYNKSSSYTQPLCIRTEGVTPWWKISLYFLGSLLVAFLLVMAALYGSHLCVQICKATLFPGEKLPSHFKQESDFPRLIVSESELDLCDPVIVSAESARLEIKADPAVDSMVPPAGLEQDSSGRHSRQNSSSSGDSGVYSAGGNSSGLHPNMTSSSQNAQRRFDSEKRKMSDMNLEFKGFPVIPDEGVVDVEV